MRILLASLALGMPMAAQATTSWTIYSGDGQTSQSGTGSGSASIDGATFNFSFSNTNSPTIIVTGGGTGPSGSHFEAAYDYTVYVHGAAPQMSFPTYCSQSPGYPPCLSPYSGNSLSSVLSANGEYYLSGPNAYLSAFVDPNDNYGIANCDSNLTQQCGYAQYTTTLGASGYTSDASGTVFVVPVELRLKGDLFGGTSTITAAIDPVLTINPDFVADSGMQASDFTIDTNGNGNASNAAVISALAGGVPEPASWAMMLCGFGLIGAGVRNRKASGLAPVR